MTTKAKAMGGSLLIRNMRFTLPLLHGSLAATGKRFALVSGRWVPRLHADEFGTEGVAFV